MISFSYSFLDSYLYVNSREAQRIEFQLGKLKTLWPLFMDGVQLSQGYRVTSRRHFTFCHSIPKILKDKRLRQPWSHPVLNLGRLDWEFSALTSRPLLLEGRENVILIEH